MAEWLRRLAANEMGSPAQVRILPSSKSFLFLLFHALHLIMFCTPRDWSHVVTMEKKNIRNSFLTTDSVAQPFTVPELSKWAKGSAKWRQAGVSVMCLHSFVPTAWAMCWLQTWDMSQIADCLQSVSSKKTAPRRHAQCVRLTYCDLLLLILRVQRL